MIKTENFIRIIRAGVYLALLAPLVYIPQTIFGAVFGKMIYFQMVVELTLPFFLYLIIFTKEQRPKINFLTKLILVFFVIIFISSLVGRDFEKSFWGYDERARGFFALLHFLFFYFYILTGFKNKEERRGLLLFVLLVGLAVALYGLAERFDPSYRIDKSATDHRIIATTGNPIFLGGYLLFLVFLSLYYYFAYKDPSRYLALSMFPLFSVVLFFTGTRAAFLGFIAGLAVFLLYFFFVFVKRKQKVIIFLLFAGVFLTLILAARSNPELLKIIDKSPTLNRLTAISWRDASSQPRLMLWGIALRAFRDNPLLGWGLENFDYGFDKYYEPKLIRSGVGETWADRAHNLFLDWLLMTGIIGLILYLLIFLSMFYFFIRQRRKEGGALASLWGGFAVFSFFAVEDPTINLLFFFSLALCSSLIKERSAEEAAPAGNLKIKPIFFLLFGAIFFPLYFYNLRPLYAGINFIKFSHLAGNNLEAKKAIALKFLDHPSPYSDSLRLRFANQIFFDADRMENPGYLAWGFERAIREMEKSQENHPGDFSYPMTLGNLYLRKGLVMKEPSDYDRAINYYQKALALSPRRQAVLFQLSTALLLKGETKEAVRLLKEAVFYDDMAGETRWRLAMALLADKDYERAYREIKASMNLRFFGRIVEEMEKAAALCVREGDYECAAREYETIVGWEPKRAEAYAQLAAAYAALGKNEKAREAALRAVELDPSYAAEAKLFLKKIGD